MFEVEKKFSLTPEDKKNLIEDSEYITRKEMRDIYWDTADYKLAMQDLWLRQRNGNFELKVPMHKSADRDADHQELETEEEIRSFLKIVKKDDLAKDLIETGYFPFCDLLTIREKYKNSPFIIDIDQVKSDNFSYNLAEIELIVNDESKIKDAIDKIMAFAKEKNLKTDYTRGKVLEYLRQRKPEHFQALKVNGIIK